MQDPNSLGQLAEAALAHLTASTNTPEGTPPTPTMQQPQIQSFPPNHPLAPLSSQQPYYYPQPHEQSQSQNARHQYYMIPFYAAMPPQVASMYPRQPYDCRQSYNTPPYPVVYPQPQYSIAPPPSMGYGSSNVYPPQESLNGYIPSNYKRNERAIPVVGRANFDVKPSVDRAPVNGYLRPTNHLRPSPVDTPSAYSDDQDAEGEPEDEEDEEDIPPPNQKPPPIPRLPSPVIIRSRNPADSQTPSHLTHQDSGTKDDDSYIDITGNSTPVLGHSELDTDRDAEGEPEEEEDSVAVDHLAPSQAVSGIVPSTKPKAATKRKKSVAQTKKIGGTSKKREVDDEGVEKRPKTKKRKKDSIAASQAASIPNSEPAFPTLPAAKSFTFLPTRKRKRIDYAALSRGAGRSSKPGTAPSSPQNLNPRTNDDPSKLYCYCRKPYTTDSEPEHFIGCDGCEEWFHYRCVGIGEEEVKGIWKWVCLGCQDRGLEVLWKEKCRGCRGWVEPESNPDANQESETPPKPTAIQTHYCTESCALSHARRRLQTIQNSSNPIPTCSYHHSEESILNSLLESSRTYTSILEADRRDMVRLEALRKQKMEIKNILKALEKRRKRVWKAIKRCVELNENEGERVCGFDGRIVGEWVVDEVDVVVAQSSRMIINTEGGEGEKEGEDNDDEDTPALCESRGKCPYHEGWEVIKWMEVEREIEEGLGRLEKVRRGWRDVVGSLGRRRGVGGEKAKEKEKDKETEEGEGAKEDVREGNGKGEDEDEEKSDGEGKNEGEGGE